MFEQVSEYFSEDFDSQDKQLHRMILQGYLSDVVGVEGMSKLLIEGSVDAEEGKDAQGGTTKIKEDASHKKNRVLHFGFEPESARQFKKEEITQSTVTKALLTSSMQPHLIPFREFKDQGMVNSFSEFVNDLVKELLQLYFILQDKFDQKKKTSEKD